MASINGVSLKKITSFEGTEGYAEQGDIYLNGKKVGFFSEDANGAPSWIDAPPEAYAKLEEISRRYFEKHPPRFGREVDSEFLAMCTTPEDFFSKLLELSYFEKEYKKT